MENSSNKSADADYDENLYVSEDYLNLHTNSHCVYYCKSDLCHALSSTLTDMLTVLVSLPMRHTGR